MQQSPVEDQSQWAGLPTGSDATDTLLNGFAAALGYRFYLLADMPVDRAATFAQQIRLSNWPMDARMTYGETGMFPDSMVVTHFGRSVLPLGGGAAMFGPSGKPKDRARMSRLLANFGIEASFAFALHGPERQHHLFVFSKPGAAPEVIGGDDMLSRSMRILETLTEDTRPAPLPARLSQREQECLKWAADGKTADETAMIMQLSPHTIETYMRSAIRKLESVNRMQAVARAIRLNII